MTSSQHEVFAQACELKPKIAHQFIAIDTQFIQDIHSSISLMRSACLVRTRFILNNFLVGLDWKSQDLPWLRPWIHPLKY